MAEAECRERWNHTSAAMALLANIHRDRKKGRAFRPSDFNPYERGRRCREGIRLARGNMGLLKQAFVSERR